jgi:hypothetical protein
MQKILELQEHHDLQKLCLTEGQTVPQQCIGSMTSLEAWSVRDRWYMKGHIEKVDVQYNMPLYS